MDPRRSNLSTRPDQPGLDEAALGALVRDVADDWQMPPQRLDDVTWRDRVAGPGAPGGPRGAGGLRWTRRFVAATALAMVATVAVSAGAIWLTTPRGIVGVASPSPSVSPSASGSTEPSPRPKLATFGELPSVTSVLVNTGGSAKLVDLMTGEISPEVFAIQGDSSRVVARPGGGRVCICVRYVVATSNDPASTILDISIEGDPGDPFAGVVLRRLTGTSDLTSTSEDRPVAVDARVTTSSDGRLAFVGWSQFTTDTGWKTGVDIVDLATLQTLDTVTLASRVPAAVGDGPWVRNAPAVALSPSGDRLLLSSFWYLWSNDENIPTGAEYWTVMWDGSTAGEPADAGSSATPATPTTPACSDQGRGFVGDDHFYVSCWTGEDPVMELRDLTGEITNRGSILTAGGQLEPHTFGNALYFWDPFNLRITRFDLLTWGFDRGEAPRPTSRLEEDVLASIARRIADGLVPTAVAKILLEPALTVSPDGTRLYALGTRLGGSEIGSSGVFVFDSTTLEPIDHWAPTADFESIAISADGAFVYAAAAPEYPPEGGAPLAPASITVYSAADGSVRLIAGDLGDSNIWFPDPVLR